MGQGSRRWVSLPEVNDPALPEPRWEKVHGNGGHHINWYLMLAWIRSGFKQVRLWYMDIYIYYKYLNGEWDLNICGFNKLMIQCIISSRMTRPLTSFNQDHWGLTKKSPENVASTKTTFGFCRDGVGKPMSSWLGMSICLLTMFTFPAWRCPKMGLPPVLIYFNLFQGFPLTKKNHPHTKG